MKLRDFYWSTGIIAAFISVWWIGAYRVMPEAYSVADGLPGSRIPIICPAASQSELVSAIRRSHPGDTIIIFQATIKRTENGKFILRTNGHELPIDLDE